MKFREWNLQVIKVEIDYESETGTYNTRTVLKNFETGITVTLENLDSMEALILPADRQYTIIVEDEGKVKRPKREDLG